VVGLRCRSAAARTVRELAGALADACRDDDRFKVMRWDAAEMQRDEHELHPTGHIVVIDTAGRLWVRTGEDPPEGWRPRN